MLNPRRELELAAVAVGLCSRCVKPGRVWRYIYVRTHCTDGRASPLLAALLVQDSCLLPHKVVCSPRVTSEAGHQAVYAPVRRGGWFMQKNADGRDRGGRISVTLLVSGMDLQSAGAFALCRAAKCESAPSGTQWHQGTAVSALQGAGMGLWVPRPR